MKEYNLVYTVKGVAKELHVSPNTVYSLIKAGRLKATKIPSLRISGSSLIEFLETYEDMDLSDPECPKPLSEVMNYE